MSPADADPPCQALPWDSEFFGINIARVSASTLSEELAARIDLWCRANKIALLYFLARSDDAATSRLATQYGFNLVDLRLTFARATDIPASPPPASVEPWKSADTADLLRIARDAYTDSRFYFDGRLPRAKCDELYQKWTDLSCQGKLAQAVLVARRGGKIAGYVTCAVDEKEHIGSIGLIGVDRALQGQGAGRDLVNAAILWFTSCGLKEIRVVTQGRNIAAQRLYQQAGFFTHSLELYFHKWYAPTT